jgi:hypothetical protein
MKRMTCLIVALGMAGGASTPTGQQQPTSALDIVEVVGCLTEAPAKTWVLTNASEPVVSKTVWTTKEALKEAEAQPLGKQRYRLLGVASFGPESLKGQKIAVKGVLIKDEKENRVNVTSLQAVAAACGK